MARPEVVFRSDSQGDRIHLAWGIEHDERDPNKDSFDLEFVFQAPDGTSEAREKEAKEVFELIRPTAELWAIKNASVAGFPTTNRKGKYDLYVFAADRTIDGRPSISAERSSRTTDAN